MHLSRLGKGMKNRRKLRVFDDKKDLMEESNTNLTSAAERRMEASRGSQSRGPVMSPGHC